MVIAVDVQECSKSFGLEEVMVGPANRKVLEGACAKVADIKVLMKVMEG